MFLADFHSVTPGPALPQQEVNAVVRRLMEEASGRDLGEVFAKYAVGSEHIAQRQVCVMPHGGEGDRSIAVFPESIADSPHGMGLQERMQNFRTVVGPVFDALYAEESIPPDDLIHATCTGYISPSPAQEMVLAKGWLELPVTHSYHMGCYGAFPPVRMAAGFLAADPEKSRIDVVHTEFCTNHFDVTKHDPAHLINTTLFSDGFIGYRVLSETAFDAGSALEVVASHEVLIPDSAEEMSWTPGSHGFDMTLARTVPVKIRNHVRTLVDRLCEKAGCPFDSETILAIHPGGPKILDHIETELGATSEQTAISHEILRAHGNMSSATVPHIWSKILASREIPDGTSVVSMAFGPGLTATGLFLRVRRRD